MTTDDEGFLKKILDKSPFMDIFVLGVLVLDLYLLQKSPSLIGGGSIIERMTQIPPENIYIGAAQLTGALIVIKAFNTIMDMGGDDDHY